MNENNYILTNCPECGTEHRVHKLRAARGMIRCKNCKFYFMVLKATELELASVSTFGAWR